LPRRSERLIWLHGRRLSAADAARVNEANQQLIGQWNDCAIQYLSSVNAGQVSDRLWLFCLQSEDQRLATRFGRRLREHIAALRPLQLKRQVNLPTPLLTEPRAPQARGYPQNKLDIGLHVGSDEWNATLVLFLYWEGRYYNPLNLQLHELCNFASEADPLWREFVCACGHGQVCCGQRGCFGCFHPDCGACRGTGWRRFAAWENRGCQIDYRSGWPLAVIDGAEQQA